MSFALRPGAVVPGGEISEAERAVRVDLAAAYRLAALNGWDDLIYTHLSATVPGEPDHFLINAFGLAFDEITASNLVKINGAGQLVGDWPDAAARPSVNVTGFALHAAVHAARADAHCVIHLHNTAGIAVSAQKHGLLPLSQHALRFHKRIAYHDYEGIALDLGERERLVHDFGQHKAMILRNHGLLAGGATAADAFHEIYFLERACQAQIQALAGGTPLRFPPEEVRQRTAAQFNREESPVIARRAWLAALRLIDTSRSDYRS